MARGLTSHRLFWGFMFLLVGLLALLQNYGYQIVDLERFWPIFLVMIGLWMMLHHKPIDGSSDGCCAQNSMTAPVARNTRRRK